MGAGLHVLPLQPAGKVSSSHQIERAVLHLHRRGRGVQAVAAAVVVAVVVAAATRQRNGPKQIRIPPGNPHRYRKYFCLTSQRACLAVIQHGITQHSLCFAPCCIAMGIGALQGSKLLCIHALRPALRLLFV